MSWRRVGLLVAIAVAAPSIAVAQTTFAVTTEAGLRAALSGAQNGDTIVFGNTITLTTGDLPIVQRNITIEGGGFSLSGNDQYRGLFVAAFAQGTATPQGVSITIQNLTIQNTRAAGGDGGRGTLGGGGGGGLGAGLFVANQATVTINNVSFVSNTAAGGSGGAGGAGLSGGGVTVNDGTLSIVADNNLGGAGALALNNTSTLAIGSSGLFGRQVRVAGAPIFSIGGGQPVTWSGQLTNAATAGALQVTGGGTLSLTNATNNYSGGTFVRGGSALVVSADGVLGAASGGLTLGDATTTGTLRISDASVFTSNRAVVLGGGAVIDTVGSSSATFGVGLTGKGGLAKNGTGNLDAERRPIVYGTDRCPAGHVRAERLAARGRSWCTRRERSAAQERSAAV